MLTNEQHVELVELIEDMVEHFCDEHTVSGQTAWLAVQNLAAVKQQLLRGSRL